MTDTNAMREVLQRLLNESAHHRAEASNHLPGDVKAHHMGEAHRAEREIIARVPAILALLATDRAAGVGEDVERRVREIAQQAVPYAAHSPYTTQLQQERRRSAKTAARIAIAASPPAPADASSLDPLLCRCENARRKGMPMLCVQCTGPVGLQAQQAAEAPPADASGEVERKAITWVDVLREWFGGERYARDYEYLDANYRKNAERVADYSAALNPTAGAK